MSPAIAKGGRVSRDTAIRVALLPDFAEEGWLSMDLVAEMLDRHLPEAIRRCSVKGMQPQLFQPGYQHRLTGKQGESRILRNVDRLLNRFLDYPKQVRELGRSVDLVHILDHSYSHLVNDVPRGRAIVTCHDLDTFRCLLDPEREARGFAFRAITRRILAGFRKAAHVCCVSRTVYHELIQTQLIPARRVSVVPLGVRPEFLLPSTKAAERRVDQLLGDGFGRIEILHVGSTIPRKRIDNLLRIFARLRATTSRNLHLVRVGGPFTAEQESTRRDLLIDPVTISVLPKLIPDELAVVYRRAALVLLPSEAEGFGLPVIEAMANGTPVVASDLPVLREVGGDTAEFVPPNHLDEWCQIIAKLLTERTNSPCVWSSRRTTGIRRGREFSWSNTAAQMVGVYQETLAQLSWVKTGTGVTNRPTDRL
jgi:glycosyltransferase involved in cell wall biosynthesis